jgi:hypothetical protein
VGKKAHQLAPFDSKGNMLDYTPREPGEGGLDWRPREPFTETLTIEGWSRGRSSVTMDWYTKDRRHYSMFASDFMDLLLRGDLGAGIPGLTIAGTWIVRKSGSNYGVSLLPKENA